MAHRKRGIRSKVGRAEDAGRWFRLRNYDRAHARIEQNKITHTIETYPTRFIHTAKSGAKIRSIIAKEFKTTQRPQQMKTLPEHGKIVCPTLDPVPVLDPAKYPIPLPSLPIIRWDDAVKGWTQARLERLWGELVQSGAQHRLCKDVNRSTNEGYHFGIWEITAQEPRLTSESVKQSPQAIKAIDNLLQCIKDFISPRISHLLQEDAPAHWEALQSIPARVETLLAAEKLSRPDLFMEGPFFTVAAKEAGSGVVHLDWNDYAGMYAFIFAVGDWEGGEFCIPELGIKIPVRPGQILAVLARVVAHFSAPVKRGRRIVFTCFTEKNLLCHTFKALTTSEPVIVVD